MKIQKKKKKTIEYQLKNFVFKANLIILLCLKKSKVKKDPRLQLSNI
jgi:hypothetical protein